jgi:hypothetical protein
MLVNLKLTAHDLTMFLGLVTLGRRYGDTELHEWSGEARSRILAELDRPETKDISGIVESTQMMPLLDLEDKKDNKSDEKVAEVKKLANKAK